MPATTSCNGLTARPAGLEFGSLPSQARKYIQTLERKVSASNTEVSTLNREVSGWEDEKYPNLKLRLKEEQALTGWLDREVERLDHIVQSQQREILCLTADAKSAQNRALTTNLSLSSVGTADSSKQYIGESGHKSPLPSPGKIRQHMHRYLPELKHLAKEVHSSVLPNQKLSIAEMASTPTAPSDGGLEVHSSPKPLRKPNDAPVFPPQTPTTPVRKIVTLHVTPGQSSTNPRSDPDIITGITRAQGQSKLLNAHPGAMTKDVAISEITKQKRDVAKCQTKLESGLDGVGSQQHSGKLSDLLLTRALNGLHPPPFHGWRTTSFALAAQDFLNRADGDRDGYHFGSNELLK